MSVENLRDREWLVEHYEVRGMSLNEIAMLVGCGQMGVTYWIHKHGITMRKRGRESRWTEADNAALRRMWAENYTCDEIGSELGRSGAGVSQHAKEIGLPRRPGGPKKRLYFRSNGHRIKVRPAVALLSPNAKNYFNSAAALERFLELKGAA